MNNFPSLSPYLFSDGSPIYKNDPTGENGEIVIKDGVMYVYMDFYFYGHSTALKDGVSINNAIDYLNTEINRFPSFEQGPDGLEYPVKFVVTGQHITEAQAQDFARNNNWNDFDPRLNLVRVEDGFAGAARNSLEKGLDYVNGVPKGRVKSKATPDNSIFLGTHHLTSTAWVHEVVTHQLNNRGPNSHILNWEDVPLTRIYDENALLPTQNVTIPSISTDRFTANPPSEFQVPYTDPNGVSGCFGYRTQESITNR
ncbi:MAG: hypothetical protein MK212_09800 [Saprospiraceae bacterium]|nr:hypothetical protein [Saprospiraceae bacterium]